MNLFEIESELFGGEVKVIRPHDFLDDRGSLTITYLKDEFRSFGIRNEFVRQMVGRSRRNVLRGLHYQTDPAMGKLMQVTSGRAFLVTVDLRPNSPTFLGYHAIVASGYEPRMIWAPGDFARGYYALEDNTVIQYNCDAYVGADKAIYWNDPDIGIDWPLIDVSPILSERDANARTAKEMWGRL